MESYIPDDSWLNGRVQTLMIRSVFLSLSSRVHVYAPFRVSSQEQTDTYVFSCCCGNFDTRKLNVSMLSPVRSCFKNSVVPDQLASGSQLIRFLTVFYSACNNMLITVFL